jgi:hypothetical protein
MKSLPERRKERTSSQTRDVDLNTMISFNFIAPLQRIQISLNSADARRNLREAELGAG